MDLKEDTTPESKSTYIRVLVWESVAAGKQKKTL